jgi:hypothetical protein
MVKPLFEQLADLSVRAKSAKMLSLQRPQPTNTIA